MVQTMASKRSRLEAGYPITYRDDNGILTEEYPDGRRFEIAVDPDYTVREVRELPPAHPSRRRARDALFRVVSPNAVRRQGRRVGQHGLSKGHYMCIRETETNLKAIAIRKMRRGRIE